MDNIGIMQGRLTKQKGDKIQSFPIGNWEREFELASEIGFSCIEWVIDNDNFDLNPIFDKRGRKKIKQLVSDFNITIPAICHDVLMDIELQSDDYQISSKAFKILENTIFACSSLGINFIEIPLVGDGSIVENDKKIAFIRQIEKLDEIAKKHNIEFLLETDLTPSNNLTLMKEMDGLSVGLNFDMGNSAYWGFEPDDELPKIGQWIKNVHIKDCTPKNYTVPLGDGNVNFQKVFKYLNDFNYDGLFILQAAPALIGNEKKTAIDYYNFVRRCLKEYYES